MTLAEHIAAASKTLREEVEAKLEANAESVENDELEPEDRMSLADAVRDVYEIFSEWALFSAKTTGLSASERKCARRVYDELLLILTDLGVYERVDDATLRAEVRDGRAAGFNDRLSNYPLIDGVRFRFVSWDGLK